MLARKIEELILRKYEIGDRLPGERDLAKKYKVSRPTVREAVVSLELAGLVHVRTNSGTYVANSMPQASDDPGAPPFEILRARMILEPEVAALAAEHHIQADLEKMEAATEQMRLEHIQNAPTEKGDRLFHCAVAKASANTVLMELIEVLWSTQQKSRMWLRADEYGRTKEIRPLWVEDHLAVLSAIKERDPKAARAAMTDHLRHIWQILLDAGSK
ncbi:MAG: FadR family transcriptional regulator [Mesorhizobium sp.]|nr:MAG: FadR family transcriptional regulator [Mesorhizobium sp.]